MKLVPLQANTYVIYTNETDKNKIYTLTKKKMMILLIKQRNRLCQYQLIALEAPARFFASAPSLIFGLACILAFSVCEKDFYHDFYVARSTEIEQRNMKRRLKT